MGTQGEPKLLLLFHIYLHLNMASNAQISMVFSVLTVILLIPIAFSVARLAALLELYHELRRLLILLLRGPHPPNGLIESRLHEIQQ